MLQHRLLGLAVSALFAVSAKAETTYTIRQGDTLEKIAKRYGVSVWSIKTANSIKSEVRLRLGSSLRIPTHTVSAGGHAVAKGETDVSIARKFGITGHQLRAANRGVDWRKLQIGTRLAIPGQRLTTKVKLASASPGVPVLSLGELTPPVQLAVYKNPVKWYTVAPRDNDWKIADRLGIRVIDLHRLNPDVRFAALKPGIVVKVPSRAHRVPPGILQLGELAPAEDIQPINSHWAMLDSDRVGVRAAPSAGSRRITLVDKFTKAKVVAKTDNWYCLVFQGGTKGWVRGDMLTALNQPAWSTAPVRRSNWSSASHVRRYARYASAPRSAARSRRSWKSWSNDSRVVPIESTSTIVSTAAKLQGVRYRYGASGASGTDCSGLTMYAYKKNGISLPHNAAAQSRKGRAVSVDNIKPGDLVFFKSARGGSRVGHTGIAIGGGKFIHASSGKGRVRVDTYTSGHYSSRFAGARTFRGSSKVKEPAPKKEVAKAEPAKAEASTPATTEEPKKGD